MIEELIDFLQKQNILPSIIGISIGIYVSLLANSLSDNIIKPILNELIDKKNKNSLNKLHIKLPSKRNRILLGQFILDIIGVLFVFLIIFTMIKITNINVI